MFFCVSHSVPFEGLKDYKVSRMVSFQETSNKTPVSERQNSLPEFPNAKNLFFFMFSVTESYFP